MQKFFLAVGVSSLSLASFYSAQAADAVRRQYANNSSRGLVSTASHNAGSRYVLYNNYSDGMYIGLKGHGKSSFKPHDDTKKDEGMQISVGPGAYAGYNMQVGSMVYGIEAEGAYLFNVSADSNKALSEDAKPTKANVDVGKATIHAKQYGFQGTVQLRLGIEVVDSILGYVSGGVALAQNQYRALEDSTANPKVPEQDAKGLDIGGALGAGVDVTLVDNLIGRLGYSVAYYPNVANTQNSLQHNVSVGVAMKL